MQGLIAGGAMVTLIGFGLLVTCIVKALRLRRAGLTEEELRAALVGLVPLNLGAFFTSILGLMMVVVGIALS